MMNTTPPNKNRKRQEIVRCTNNFLLMDISNTFTKFAASTRERIGVIRRRQTPSVSATWVRSLQHTHPHSTLVLSSVVPTKTRLVRQNWDGLFFLVKGDADLGIPIDYPNKKQIGADRLANAVAASQLYGAPAIVIDFGTATTFDVIDRRGAYVGGIIAPGLNVMTDYLHEKTALLPRIQIHFPRRVIGRSTVEAMYSGAIIGYRGLIKEVIAALHKELGGNKKIHIIATGGQAMLMAKVLPMIQEISPALTLEGLRLIGNHSFSRKAT